MPNSEYAAYNAAKAYFESVRMAPGDVVDGYSEHFAA